MGTALTERPCHVSQGFITRTALTSGAALSRQSRFHHAHCSHQRRGLVTSAMVSSRALLSPAARPCHVSQGLITATALTERPCHVSQGLITATALTEQPCHVSQGLITRTALRGLVTSIKVSSRPLPSLAALALSRQPRSHHAHCPQRPCHVSQGLITRTALTSGATLSRQPRSHHAHCPTGRVGFGDEGGKEVEGLRKSVRGLGA